MTGRRVVIGGSRLALNRTRLQLLVDGDDGSCCVLHLGHGNGNSDDLWYIDLVLSETRVGRWLSRVYWWARDHRPPGTLGRRHIP